MRATRPRRPLSRSLRRRSRTEVASVRVARRHSGGDPFRAAPHRRSPADAHSHPYRRHGHLRQQLRVSRRFALDVPVHLRGFMGNVSEIHLALLLSALCLEATMLKNSAKSVLVLAMLAAAGCASIPERDPVLEDARISVNAARRNPQIATYAPAELDQAVATLRQADDLAARGGRIGDVDQLAMLASQRAVLAQEAARARSEEAALMVQRRANDAQVTANMSRRQADSAQVQAAAAQRQAEDAQRLASSMQCRADVYAPPAYDYRRRQNERVYEANVSYVRAVVGPPQQRCWVDREQVTSHPASTFRAQSSAVRSAASSATRLAAAMGRISLRVSESSVAQRLAPTLAAARTVRFTRRTCSDANRTDFSEPGLLGCYIQLRVAMSIACK